jgi:hypothetical protein
MVLVMITSKELEIALDPGIALLMDRGVNCVVEMVALLIPQPK